MLVVKNSHANGEDLRCRLDAWVQKIPWSRTWQPTPVFLPGESHRQRSLVGYSPWDCKELEMTATHSSILAWKIPWTEEPGGLQSMGLQRVGHDWVTSHTHTKRLKTHSQTHVHTHYSYYPIHCLVHCHFPVNVSSMKAEKKNSNVLFASFSPFSSLLQNPKGTLINWLSEQGGISDCSWGAAVSSRGEWSLVHSGVGYILTPELLLFTPRADTILRWWRAGTSSGNRHNWVQMKVFPLTFYMT